MSGLTRVRVHVLAAVATLLGSLLLLSCQPSQPAATPKGAEKATAGVTAAAPTKAPDKPAEKPLRGGTLRIVDTAEYPSLDPNVMTGQNPFYSLYEQLVEPDKDGNLTKEGLARDWAIGSDGKSITFKLREGVKFHDGTDFDAAAVKSNLDRMKDPATKSPFRSYYEFVASVEVVDKLTVRLNLSQPDVLILPRLAGGAGGLMVSPAAVKKYGQDFGRNPVGSGPFQFAEWKAGDYLSVKRFQGYWKKDKDGSQLPYLEGVVYRIITDPNTGVANLRTGQADLMGGGGGIAAGQRPLVKNDPNLAYQEMAGSSSGIGMSTKLSPFDNKAVRQAVALALDREGIAAKLDATPSASVIHPIERAYDDGKSGVFPARDVAKAKVKMAEAGYGAGGLKVKYTGSNAPDTVTIGEILQANLSEIGIGVEIEALAGSVLATRRMEGNVQMTVDGTGIVVGDPGHYFSQYWYSRGSRNYYGPYGNPRFDETLDKALATYDQKARTALYSEAAKVMVDDAPWIPTHMGKIFTGLSKKVRNFVNHPLRFERITDVWLAQ